jgi:lauroyl/myristoyl acyltransferase
MKFIYLKDLYFLSVIAIVRLLGWLSLPGPRKFVVNSLAFAAYNFSKAKRRLIEKNLLKAFAGKLSQDQMRHIVKGVFYETWQEMFFWSLPSTKRAADNGVELRGVEHLHDALRQGRGVILWETNGIGRRLSAKRILSENGFAIHQVHGADALGGFLTDDSSASWVRHRLVKRFFDNCEKQFVTEMISLPKSNSLAFTRILLNRLNQNAVLCVTGDGRVGQKLIPLTFLGRTTLFATGMVTLARISGSSILPMFCIPQRNGTSVVTIEGPIHIESDVDRERALENSLKQYGALLETHIRRDPELYRNWHLLGEFLDD